MSLTLEELKERVLSQYDPDSVVDALELSTDDLVNAFEDKLLENQYKFEEFSDEDGV